MELTLLVLASRGLNEVSDLPKTSPYRLEPESNNRPDLASSVPPSLITHYAWCRNINLLPIIYALQPRLRDRLTLR